MRIGLAVLVLGLVGGGLWWALAACGGLDGVQELLTAGGWQVLLGFIILFGLWNLVLPPMPLQLLAGHAYGFAWGMISIYLGSTVAIVTALLARTALRAQISKWLAERPVWRAIDKSVTDTGWRAIVLLRLANVCRRIR